MASTLSECARGEAARNEERGCRGVKVISNLVAVFNMQRSSSDIHPLRSYSIKDKVNTTDLCVFRYAVVCVWVAVQLRESVSVYPCRRPGQRSDKRRNAKKNKKKRGANPWGLSALCSYP